MRWLLLCLLTGCADATAPRGRMPHCSDHLPYDTPSALAYRRCLETQ